ncbi:MAG: enoyl-CoA hydratase-related protein [Armatimonadota bacterium]|nr:enoyl-CoA hydratase-related protein [Armatimonadota bacterium]MDR5689988.1 enoyl-CoA hydratase-related protein [Armatimonadota bacterium]MDR7386220.1 enoyl-CoA hydratase-related protein [Armatimonadota bacterium]MDR7388468.1 enoyl-CoA hydratase-related protein [Armatimonadota bacterium]MDR7391581.1 enoyl-CoA hydratase-related protein [Armatimonadota bacterium]
MAVEFSREGGLGYVTLNRPPANSYDFAFIEELDRAIQQAEADPEVRVVVVRSALERFFSAGADVRAFSENPPDRNMELVRYAHRVLGRIAQVPKVFIAQIGGHALGGGLEIALACDLRFGARGDYRVGLPEVTLGLLPGNGGTQRLPRLVGWSRALDLMVTGRTLTAEEAHAYGILDRLVPAERLAEETAEYARKLASGAVRAVGAIKLAVRLGVDRPLEDGLRLERELVDGLFRSEDAQEGIRAFLEKRAPLFRGL